MSATAVARRLSAVSLSLVLATVGACTTSAPSAAPTEAEPSPAVPRTVGGAKDPAVPLPAPVIEKPKQRCGREVTRIPSDVLFDTDSWHLRAEARDVLRSIAAQVRSATGCPKASEVRVEGHTDSRGDATYGVRLSEKRAKAVGDQLESFGVQHITLEGYGETRPRCSPEYRNGRPDYLAMQCNRRVEIVLIRSGVEQ